MNPKITCNSQDQVLVRQLFLMLQQLCEESTKNENLCYFQLLCLIAVLERNLEYSPKDPGPPVEKKNISRMLNHIHKYMQNPEKLTLSHIAGKFNISSNQLGIYFRREMGQSVKQYIKQCRMEVIGRKVAKSEVSFSEIAFQFGYVDESHFYKSFKSYYGKSPTAYRQEKQR